MQITHTTVWTGQSSHVANFYTVISSKQPNVHLHRKQYISTVSCSKGVAVFQELFVRKTCSLVRKICQLF